MHQQGGQMFDPNQWDPNQGDGQLPAGTHSVVIVKSETKATNDNSSSYLLVTLKIIDGQYVNLTGPLRLHLFNTKSAKAVEIASKRLSAICHAVGYLQALPIPALTPIFNKPFQVVVTAQADNPEFTEIEKILDIHGNAPQRGQVPQPAQQQMMPPQGQMQAPHGGQFVQPPQGHQAPAQAPAQAYGQPPTNYPQQQQQPPVQAPPQQYQQPPQMEQQPPQQQGGHSFPWGDGPPPTQPGWGQPPQ